MRKLLFVFLLVFPLSIYSQIQVCTGSDNDIIGRMVALPQGKLLMFFEKNPGWNAGDIYLKESTDGGNTWTLPQTVVDGSGNQSTFFPVYGTDDSLHLYYASDESGHYILYHLSSEDGLVWGNKYALDLGWPSNADVYDPTLTLHPDGHLVLAYTLMNGGSYLAEQTGPSTFDGLKRQIQAGCHRTRICKMDSGKWLAAYHRNDGSGNYDVYIRTSDDLINWAPEVQLTTNGNSHDAFCGISPDNLFVVYYAKVFPTVYNLYRRISYDGITWQAEENITMDSKENTQPSFVYRNDSLFLTYTHAVNYSVNNDIYLRIFPDELVHSEQKPDNLFRLFSVEDGLYLDNPPTDDYKLSFFDVSGKSLGFYYCSGNQNKIPVLLKPGLLLCNIETPSVTGCCRIIVLP
jgi:hypothetical protein